MRVGEFFGELAALDWGAGYGYTRLATVIATSAARLPPAERDLDALNPARGAPACWCANGDRLDRPRR
jgi:hypothetical protein